MPLPPSRKNYFPDSNTIIKQELFWNLKEETVKLPFLGLGIALLKKWFRDGLSRLDYDSSCLTCEMSEMVWNREVHQWLITHVRILTDFINCCRHSLGLIGGYEMISLWRAGVSVRTGVSVTMLALLAIFLAKFLKSEKSSR